MNLQITEELIIPSDEIKWRFSRSSGPGGQNVNKIESQVEIIFNILKSKTLSSDQKSLLLKKLNNKIINGCISIKVQEKRSQLKNRQIAIHRLSAVIKDILLSERKVTTPTKSSQKIRIKSKKKRGKLKLNRQNKLEQDL
tara:strand:+ start:128 stop:547 length:420 start_codon:yes stop_codon:yes gene_type:complete